MKRGRSVDRGDAVGSLHEQAARALQLAGEPRPLLERERLGAPHWIDPDGVQRR